MPSDLALTLSLRLGQPLYPVDEEFGPRHNGEFLVLAKQTHSIYEHPDDVTKIHLNIFLT